MSLPLIATLLRGEMDRSLVRAAPYVRFTRRKVTCFFHHGRTADGRPVSTFEARRGAEAFFEAARRDSR